MHLGDEFDVEVGSTEALGRFAGQSPHTVVAALPNASVDWLDGNSSIGYRVATFQPGPIESDDTQAGAWLPEFSLRHGELVIERGVHQEIAWARKTDVSEMTVGVFADEVLNPVIEAMGHFAEGSSGANSVDTLLDNASGLLRASGPNFSSDGIVASVERRLPGGNDVRLSYANSNALVMPVLPRAGGDGRGAWCRPIPAGHRCIPSRSPELWTGPEPAGGRVTAGSPKTLSLKWLRLRWTQPSLTSTSACVNPSG